MNALGNLFRRLLSGSIINLGIRASTLFLRFALSFYIVSQMGLPAAGIYGLAIGAVGLAPATLGWGLNYYVARQVVGQDPAQSAALIRNRIVVTLGSLAAMTCVAAPVLLWLAPPEIRTLYFLILILVWLETLALDIYMPMIGLEMAVQANIMVFIRSAAWIPVVVALGIWSAAFRTLDAVFIGWIASHFVALALLPFFLRQWPVSTALSTPVTLGWARERVSRYWYIYLSDVSIVGLVYVDRYIVSFLLGLVATGIYSFYWSITNALQTLMMTAVVQVALPRMVKAFRSGDPAAWRAELGHQILKTAGFALVLSVAIYGMTEAIIQFSPPGRFPVARPLFLLLLAAAVVRSCSDLLNVGITSSGNDRHYAVTNLAGVVLTVVLSAVCLSLFGLIGAGISSLATAGILVVMRLYCLKLSLKDVAGDQGAIAAIRKGA